MGLVKVFVSFLFGLVFLIQSIGSSWNGYLLTTTMESRPKQEHKYLHALLPVYVVIGKL